MANTVNTQIRFSLNRLVKNLPLNMALNNKIGTLMLGF